VGRPDNVAIAYDRSPDGFACISNPMINEIHLATKGAGDNRWQNSRRCKAYAVHSIRRWAIREPASCR
jgi:hypothetical protein